MKTIDVTKDNDREQRKQLMAMTNEIKEKKR